MKVRVLSALLLSGAVVLGVYLYKSGVRATLPGDNSAGVVSGDFSPEELRSFIALEPIDAHAHVRRTYPAFNAMIERLHIQLLDILVVNDLFPEEKDLQAEKKTAMEFIHSAGGHAILCTSFDPYKMREPGFQQRTISELNDDFDHGAIAVKIWKNIGMEIKDPQGNYVLPDDPTFAPIYQDIAAHNKTLVAHIADPDSAWAPPNPASPDYSYYNQEPDWYMYNKPHPASKRQILLARDHILEQNPKLRLVGAHLGSMEADLHDLGRHLDRYPNFAVDIAARMPYFALQPRDDMIAFILKYQDRLIYGTDLTFSATDSPERRMRFWRELYARDWRFFATNDTVQVEMTKGQGLALPEPVLRKIYHDNAVRWFPGIVQDAN